MTELIAKSLCESLLPLNIGELHLSEVDPGSLTSIAAFKDQDAELSKMLLSAHGLPAPEANRATGKEGARAIWFGHRMMLLMGPHPDAALAKHAALTDQSDAWTCVQLEGPGAREVLSRLTPLDLRDTSFEQGHTARTELRHIMASVTRIDADTWMILVFRGFAETLVHDLQTAMQTVSARYG